MARPRYLLLILLAACDTRVSIVTPTPPVLLCMGVTCPNAGENCDPIDGLCKCPPEGCPLPPLQAVCTGGTRWAPGTAAFRDATAEWNLTGVEGTRLAITDVDGDGFADVFVRAGGNAPDDFGSEGVRRSFLLRNTGSGRFEDVTLESGIRATRNDHGDLGRPGEVVAFGDVDNDGDLDVYTGMATGVDGALEGETSEILLNDGSGRFTLGPEDGAIRRADDVDAVAGAAFVDFDRDGNLDLWIGEHNYTPAGTQDVVFLGDHLYRGDGGGGFTEVTAEVGLETAAWSSFDDLNEGRAHSRAWSAAACDLDNDGTPELLAASYGRAPNHLWQGSAEAGAVRFENRSVASGYAYDGNQDWTDNEFAKCYCQANPAAVGCDGAAAPRIRCDSINWQHLTDREPFRLGGNSGSSVCADVNNDGYLDLLVTEITHWWAGDNADRTELLVNTGEAPVRFERPGGSVTGLVREHDGVAWDQGDMTAAVLDFDNDGWPDIYVGASDYPGNRGLLFHQDAPGHFVSVPIEEGVDHHRSHGVVHADFDHDGDLDLMVGHSRSRCDASRPANCYETRQVRLFENVLGDQGNWVQVKLAGGAGTNAAAIGARVTVTAGEVTQTQEVGGGFGHYGIQNDMVLHFGLGTACEATVTVRWPDGALTTQTATLLSGHRYVWTQGEEPVAADRVSE